MVTISFVNKFKKMAYETEEFNNFMHRVNEVTNIIKKLASNDKEEQELGDYAARKYLCDEKSEIFEQNENSEDVVLKIKENKTILNRKALLEDINKDPNKMSQEAFMKEVELDADRRYQDRLKRTERMETLKKQANNAFRRGEYEKALVLFDKAIEQIKDSPLLYNNRALTLIKLKQFEKAKENLENWALKLNEDNIKSWLLLAKANYLMGDLKEYKRCITEALERNPKESKLIDGYVRELEGDVAKIPAS